MKQGIGVILLACALLGATGCVHYHVNRGARQPFNSIYVVPVANRSDQVQIQGILWKQLVTQLNLASSVTVVSSPRQADALLSVVITQLDQGISSTTAEDSVRADSYMLTLTGHCSLVDSRTGMNYFKDQPISTWVNIYAGHRFADSKYQAMPELTRDFAQSVCNLILHSW